jgi:hypothetical protein
VVTRRIRRPAWAVHLPEAVTLSLGHLRRPAHVQLQVAEWSDGECELRLIPRTSHLRLWTERRQRRYFAAAHSAADELAAVAWRSCWAPATTSATSSVAIAS